MADGPLEPKDPEAAAPFPTVESVFQRRIEFHPARKPYSPISSGGDFYLETLNPGVAAERPPPASVAGAPPVKRSEGREFHEHGLDPELSFRITFRRIGAGLANLGNTCFLNSVLQCLTYTEPFAAYLQSGKHKSSCRTAGFCAMCALQNHVMNALQSTGKILSPSHLVKNLRCISRNFRNSRQEDAHEYMVNLLESMHKCCLPSGVPSESPSAYEKSLVHKIFGGRLRSQVKCMQCSNCSNKFDPFLDLSLEIVKADSLCKALSRYTAVEQLDGGERQYQCQRCKQKVRALKQLTIHKAPHVLTIHLKRFSSVMPGQKIDKKVDFAPTLDLKPFVSDPHEGGLKYTLYGVLVHAGWSTHSGHYYCFIRTSSGMWHSLDDNQVLQVSEKTVFEQKAYMLFYVRDRDSFKKSIDVYKEYIPSDASASGINGAFKSIVLDRKLSTSQHTSVISVSDATSRDELNSLLNSSSQHPLQKETYSLQKNVNRTPKEAYAVQNSNPMVLKEASNFHFNVDIMAIKSQQKVGSEDSLKVTSHDLLLKPLATSLVNQNVMHHAGHSTISKESDVVCTSHVDDTFPTPVSVQVSNGYCRFEGCHLDTEAGIVVAQMNNSHIFNPSSKKCSDKGFMKNNTQENGDATNASQQNVRTTCSMVITDITAKPMVVNPCGKSSDMNGCSQIESFDAKLRDYKDNEQCQKGEERTELQGAGFIDAYEKPSTANGSVEEGCIKVTRKESSADRFRPAKVKHKKNSKLSLVKALHFSHTKLFLTSLSVRKSKKHKKCRKHVKSRNLHKDKDHVTTKDREATTSEAASTVGVNFLCPSERSCSGSEKESYIRRRKNVKMDNSDPVSASTDDTRERYGKNCSMPVTSEQLKKCTISVANQNDSREKNTNDKGPDQHGFLSLLTRGLKESTVPRWDDTELPHCQNYGLEDRKIDNNNIGYVLDEWDEEYDRGKRKKVKKSRHLFGGPNPFQEAANKMALHKMKAKLMNRTSSGNEPFRI